MFMSLHKNRKQAALSVKFNLHSTKTLSFTQPETQCKFKDKEVRDQKTQSLRKQEKTLFYQLNQNQYKCRQRILEWAFIVGRHNLQLKCKTIELAMRIFDYYCFLKSNGCQKDLINIKKNVNSPLDNKDQRNLTLLTCLFTCSKYNEVYPPCVNDFIYVSNDKFSKHEIIKKQIEIIQLTQFSFTISTVSGWYEHLYGDFMPQWAYQCYLRVFIMRTEDLARSIKQFMNNSEFQGVKPSDYVKKMLQKLNVFQNNRDGNDRFISLKDKMQE